MEDINTFLNDSEKNILKSLLIDQLKNKFSIINILNLKKDREKEANRICNNKNLLVFDAKVVEKEIFNNYDEGKKFLVRIENQNSDFKKEILNDFNVKKFKNMIMGLYALNKNNFECFLNESNFNILKNINYDCNNILFIKTKNDYCYIIPKCESV